MYSTSLHQKEPYALVYLLDNVKHTWERHAKTWFQEHNRKTEVSKTFFWNHFFTFTGVNHLALVKKSLVIAIWDFNDSKERYIAGVRIPMEEVLNFDFFEFFDFTVNLQAQKADGHVSKNSQNIYLNNVLSAWSMRVEPRLQPQV